VRDPVDADDRQQNGVPNTGACGGEECADAARKNAVASFALIVDARASINRIGAVEHADQSAPRGEIDADGAREDDGVVPRRSTSS
jgi:hypothetical protein